MNEWGYFQAGSRIPRGLEVLVKKAAVDPAFKALLLVRRAEAAATIGLTLEPAERLMLQSAPAAQLEAIIARTNVPQEHRRAFLGQAAAAMMAALGIVGLGTAGDPPDKILQAPGGIAPNPPPAPPTPPLSPEAKIEEQVKAVIAKRFQVDKDKVKSETSLVQDLKADDVQLSGLKRQLEKDNAIKLAGDNFFEKVKTVGDLVKAVQTAVKNRPNTPVPRPRPVMRGIRADVPRPNIQP